VQERVVDLLLGTGPRTGAELLAALGGEAFGLWKTCELSPRLTVSRVGRRYLRLGRRIDGYARLSPSVLREFLTYAVVGLRDDPEAVARRVAEVETRARQVSERKLALARRVVADIAEPLAEGPGPEDRFCVLVAGDIVFGMAHEVDRPERSTGTMVNGSDLDLVVVVRDDAPEELVRRLDDTIYQKKFQYLRSPAFREEIDYVVKRFATLREQTAFDSFRRMVACKIYDEAILIHGSRELFDAGKALLRERGVVEALRELEAVAVAAREERERRLLATDQESLTGEDLFLFHTDDESEEFE